MNFQKDKRKINKIESIAKNLIDDASATHALRRASRNLVKELELYKNHLTGKRLFAKNLELLSKRNKIKIQIGGGSHTLEGYINIDIVPPADILFDVREGIPIGDDFCEQIFSEHFFEHIDYPNSAKRFINECYRILKPGGVMIVGVPDSELMLSSYIKREKGFYNRAIKTWYSKRNCLKDINTYIDLVNYHFRDQDDDAKYNPHYWAYDFDKLKSLAISAGFHDVKKWKFNSKIANPKRKFGSIYIEAKK